MRRWGFLISAVALSLAGCSQDSESHPRPLKPVATSAPSPVVIQRQQEMRFEQPQARHPAKEGRPPLVYMLESPAQVQVIDAQDGSVVAQAALLARAIISVDSAGGVRAGGQQLAPGPIPGQHVYQIFVTTGTENEYRTGLVRPGEEH